MKKILFGMLALSTLVLGAQKGLETSEEKVNVTAKVVKALTMKVEEHVDFGLLTPGQEEKYAEKSGLVSIQGTPGERILVYVKDNGNQFNKLTNPKANYKVTMKTGNGTEKNEQMEARLSLFVEHEEDQTASITLNEAGVKNISIGGYTTAAADQKEGSYKGEITVKALYE